MRYNTWIERFFIEVLEEHSKSNKEIYRDTMTKFATISPKPFYNCEEKYKRIIQTIPEDCDDLYSLFLTHSESGIRKIAKETYLENMVIHEIVESVRKEFGPEGVTKEEIFDFFEQKPPEDEYWIEIIDKVLSKHNRIQSDPTDARNYIIKYLASYLQDLCGW